MKGKIMIALVVLALVFGLGLASCDNGAQPKIDAPGDKTVFEYYFSYDYLKTITVVPGTGTTSGFYAGKFYKENTGKGNWDWDTTASKWKPNTTRDPTDKFNTGDYDEISLADYLKHGTDKNALNDEIVKWH